MDTGNLIDINTLEFEINIQGELQIKGKNKAGEFVVVEEQTEKIIPAAISWVEFHTKDKMRSKQKQISLCKYHESTIIINKN